MTTVIHQLLVVDALRLMSPVSRGGFQSTIQRHLGSTLMCKVRDIMHCTRDGIWHVENMTLLQIHSRWDFWLRCSKKKMVYLTIYTGNVCSDTMKFESSFKRSIFLVGTVKVPERVRFWHENVHLSANQSSSCKKS